MTEFERDVLAVARAYGRMHLLGVEVGKDGTRSHLCKSDQQRMTVLYMEMLGQAALGLVKADACTIKPERKRDVRKILADLKLPGEDERLPLAPLMGAVLQVTPEEAEVGQIMVERWYNHETDDEEWSLILLGSKKP